MIIKVLIVNWEQFVLSDPRDWWEGIVKIGGLATRGGWGPPTQEGMPFPPGGEGSFAYQN